MCENNPSIKRSNLIVKRIASFCQFWVRKFRERCPVESIVIVQLALDEPREDLPVLRLTAEVLGRDIRGSNPSDEVHTEDVAAAPEFRAAIAVDAKRWGFTRSISGTPVEVFLILVLPKNFDQS